MKKKLLYIVNVDWFFISHRLPIAKAAINRGFEVSLASSFNGKNDDLEKLSIDKYPINIDRKTLNPFKFFLNLVEVINILKKVQPDVVHLVTIKPVILGCFAALFNSKKPKVIASISGLGYVFTAEDFFSGIRKKIILFLYKIAFLYPNLIVIFQNQDDMNSICKATGLNKNKTILINGSGVDLDLFKASISKNQVPKVIFPARLLISKGIREFLFAAEKLHKLGRFILVGQVDKNHKDCISKSFLDKCIKKGYVEYWGFSNSMEKVLNKASIVVLPSYREGLPKVLSEAAACGKPIVTTDVPGCRDTVIHGITGIIVPKKNPYALAEGIKKIINDKNLQNNMSKQARYLAEKKFDIKKIITIHLNLYINGIF
ncbi:MAG: glycosyltransferase family 4 protein [Prochlorococcus marinus XMU1422]|nr:glycosyltransferase family 4 protein [Prochlorococcus marinus XMU1421]MBO7013258.1 glycosyltransferase family 4 protein [Prochlorococcus marinus XMU1422]MCR8542287.1 glycosyltransferase family 4 protein [Prochlorococcus marinus XMU1423]